MSARRVLAHAFAGGGLGLCVGVLMGMTTTAVVATVIGALTALFATIFGDQVGRSTDAGAPRDPARFARIGAFGALCTVGALVGVSIRAHNLLGETPAVEVAGLEAAGFSRPVALQLYMYRTFGLLQADDQRLHPATNAPPPANVNQSTLSAGPAASECRQRDTKQYGDDPAAIVASWKKAGGDWATVADALAGSPPDKQLAMAKAAWSLACGGQ
jgi:hypothetical protein